MEFLLAQVNIALMRGEIHERVMKGLASRVAEMNELAEKSAGFVWRCPGSEVTPEALGAFKDLFNPFLPNRIFYNMSVWESVEQLRQYSYQTPHVEMLREHHKWVEKIPEPCLALWWIPADYRPTIKESAERIRSIREKGATQDAFTFREPFPESR